MTRRKYFYPALLIGLFLVLILLSAPGGSLYGSYTDWLSQHVRLGETIRSACIEQKSLIPSFLPLGGGSNGYQFSYYGYLRPDILIGCLFPHIPMVYFIIGYALAGYLCSILLCYTLLCQHTQDCFVSFIGSVLFLTAACFFHTHRQIMFINYMPFLMLALLCIRKKRFSFLPLCILLIILNSFYYSIACLAVLGWYWLRLEGKDFWRAGVFSYLKSVFLSIGLAAILLVPTGLVILEHRRASQNLSAAEILLSGMDFHALLYNPYGMGLSAVCLYLLILGLSLRKYRIECFSLLAVSMCSLAAWLLNGTLYARGKILIPFVPLIILVCTELLQELKMQNVRWKLWPCLVLIPVLFLNQSKRNYDWISADICILILVVLFLKLYCRSGSDRNVKKMPRTLGAPNKWRISSSKRYCLSQLLLCLLPCLLFYQTSQNEQYVKKEDVFSQASTDRISFPHKNAALYRYDTMNDVLNTGNLVKDTEFQKSAMYSSVTNKGYVDFYYDTMMSPVQINNRMAVLPSNNPFLMNFLGVRYLLTDKTSVPDGYQVISQTPEPGDDTDVYMAAAEPGSSRKAESGFGSTGLNSSGNQVVSENSRVLPVAYVTSSTISETQFGKLDRYDRLDAVTRFTVVPGEGMHGFSTKMKDYSPSYNISVLPDTVHFEKTENGWLLDVKKDSNVTLTLEEPITDNILLLDFEVVNKGGQAVVIDINKIRNKLSGKSAAYPNGNTTFHYQFSDSSEGGLDTLKVSLSKGKYLLKNVNWHTYEKQLMNQKKYTSVESRGLGKHDILSCRAISGMNSYFVTSIPYQKGLEILVDGEKVPVLKLNQAFAGTALSQGTHNISVRFHAPGLRIGFIFTFLCWMIYLFGLVRAAAAAHVLVLKKAKKKKQVII